MLEWLGEENKQKKARPSKCAWIIFPWISMSWAIHRFGLNKRVNVNVAVIAVEFPKFYRIFLYS